jgi:hypothetical protein
MAAPAPVLIGKVQVRASHLDPLKRILEAESDHRARDVDQLTDLLLGDRVGERGIRSLLLGDGSDLN